MAGDDRTFEHNVIGLASMSAKSPTEKAAAKVRELPTNEPTRERISGVSPG